jgi:hypothetical protein
MHSKVPLGVAIDGACAPSPGRDLAVARREATETLERYAVLLRQWNDPDDTHTRQQLRNLMECVIEEHCV